MNKFMYSVHDKAAGSYSDPMVMLNDQVARRSFAVEMQNKESMIAKFPTDFTLLCVAEFNTVTGEVTAIDPRPVCRGTDFIQED